MRSPIREHPKPHRSLPLLSQHNIGQGLVEFALVLPVLLLIVYGTIEFGRLLFFYTAVTTSSREAARYGSAVGSTGGGPPYFRDCTGIMQAALQAGKFAGMGPSDVVIQYDNGPGTTPFASCSSTVSVELGDRIVVNTSVNYKPIVPIESIPTFPIQSSAARTILKDVKIEGTPPNTPTPAPPTLTPTNTSTPTKTPTNSPTPTETTIPSSPTATLAPPTESSPAPTATPDCSLLDAGQITTGNKDYEIVLFNWYPSETVSIVQIYTRWGSGLLKKITLGGSQIWSGNDHAPDATISSFSGNTDLDPGAKTLHFDLSISVDEEDDLRIDVNFSNGCSISRINFTGDE